MTMKLAVAFLLTLTLFGAFWTSIGGFAAGRAVAASRQ
jgi:hypothetical protein